ncbi:histidine phosphotransferase family protein [Thalassovita sp.]|uniref:histidine phosphotransferase family protein n=1 Tax=Thalassovita sp. TaxID=1979401 RepID=UPI002B266F6A|nr:histidine phosphotransferase family protein [Thalassovita sp.]
MNQNKPDLPQLIASRICHDLISPIGAIGNGLELLQMETPASPSAEMSLITDSLENANARIRFFRIAFGHASDGQMVSANELQSILGDLMRSGRQTYDWQETMDCERREARAVFLALLCMESALPFGGKIVIDRSAGRWHIRGSGRRVDWDTALWDGPWCPGDIAANQVHFALLPNALDQIGRAAEVDVTDETIAITF